MKDIYMDYSATTPVKKEVLGEMLPFLSEEYGNASSLHTRGRGAKDGVDKARTQIAKALNAEEREIYFTAGGTESDNWAIRGIAEANIKKGNHIITSKIEHHAVLHTCEELEKKGFEVTYLDVDEKGLVNPEDVRNAIKDNTILVTIMFANNEIGTVQPIKEIGEITKEKGVYFHTDAVQAFGNAEIDVKELNIDLLSMSAHKIYGPKGIGALYISKMVRIASFVTGGAQERKRRGGTENVPGIVGFGKAAEMASTSLNDHIKDLTDLRNYFIQEVTAKIDEIIINGDLDKRLPGNINISFKYIEGESLLLYLDHLGVSVSTGSACTSGSFEPSHVLRGIKVPDDYVNSTLRFTLGDFTTKEDVDYVINNLIVIVDKLRAMSPLYKK